MPATCCETAGSIRTSWVHARVAIPTLTMTAPGADLPAGRPTRKRRKPPFALIPGQVEIFPPVQDDEHRRPQPRSGSSDADRPTAPIEDDLDHHSFHDRPTPMASRR